MTSFEEWCEGVGGTLDSGPNNEVACVIGDGFIGTNGSVHPHGEKPVSAIFETGIGYVFETQEFENEDGYFPNGGSTHKGKPEFDIEKKRIKFGNSEIFVREGVALGY